MNWSKFLQQWGLMVFITLALTDIVNRMNGQSTEPIMLVIVVFANMAIAAKWNERG